MRYLASFIIVLLLAGCASFDKSAEQRRDEYRDWYKNPCSRC